MKSFFKKLATIHTTSFENPYDIALDLSYITDRIIVCSCPTTTTRKTLYRNDLADLVNYLRIHHGVGWHLWNLRSEMREDTYDIKNPLLSNHITYMPWRDHECPTFDYLCSILKSIQTYLNRDKSEKSVAVIHCKLGKGRSGLICVGLLISSLGYSLEDAQILFTEKRMRPGFGEGVSILCQKRYCLYVELHKNEPYTPTAPKVKIHRIRLLANFYQSSYDNRVRVYLVPTADDIPNQPENQQLVMFHPEELDDSCREHSLAFKPIPALCVVSLDMKIVVEQVISSTLPIKCSHAFTCLNLFWEEMIQQTSKSDPFRSKLGVVHTSRFSWTMFDGFKGLSKKGSRVFEELELEWEYDENYREP